MVEETAVCPICGRKKAILPFGEGSDAGLLIHFCLGYKENDEATYNTEGTDDRREDS